MRVFRALHILRVIKLPPHMRLMCEVIIGPGEECKSHIHQGDTEIYYILSGRAEYEGAEGESILEPGDVITTGTPPGVGMGMKPPRYLKPGDRMEVSITGLGTQRQVVAAG